MKKLLLILLLILMPFSVAEAFPNEPAGFAKMYWGETLNDVKHNYSTSFLRYYGKTGVLYMVTIPDAYGELGIKGRSWPICYFYHNKLSSITFFFPREADSLDKDYKDMREYLTSICGRPVYRNGYDFWYGNTTVMSMHKLKDGFSIILLDSQFMRIIQRYVMQGTKKNQ